MNELDLTQPTPEHISNIMTDVRYALAQLGRYRSATSPYAADDCVRRAADALERVAAELKATENGD